MRTKKPAGLVSTAGATRLMENAAMGAATGLCFALLLAVVNPDVETLLEHGGSAAMRVFVGTLVTTFAIGASLTGAVLILTEDNES